MDGMTDLGIDTKRRVLVVEDEVSIRQGLCDVLRYRGHAVEWAATGTDGLHRGLAGTWDLIVLDIMLPEVDGFAICERLRRAGSEAPILMLTAKGDEDDIVRGLEAGADDYVTKPFGIRELMARVEALLRRSPRSLPDEFVVGTLRVSVGQSEARDRDHRFALSEREIRLLRTLSREPGRVISRKVFLREAWGMNNVEQIETRTVDVHIANLRRKLGKHGAMIVTVRGQGYRLCPPP